MTIEFTFRVLGMIVFAAMGARFGVASADAVNLPEDANGWEFREPESLQTKVEEDDLEKIITNEFLENTEINISPNKHIQIY